MVYNLIIWCNHNLIVLVVCYVYALLKCGTCGGTNKPPCGTRRLSSPLCKSWSRGADLPTRHGRRCRRSDQLFAQYQHNIANYVATYSIFLNILIKCNRLDLMILWPWPCIYNIFVIPHSIVRARHPPRWAKRFTTDRCQAIALTFVRQMVSSARCYESSS